MRIKQWWHSWLIAADATKCYGERVLRSPISQDLPLQINSLEERILYSATPLDPSALAETQQVATPTSTNTDSTHSSSIDEDEVITTAQTPPLEVVIIDSKVPDIEQLFDDLEQSNRSIEILILDRELDGIEQITDFLDSKANVSALHIVSHAETGAIQLGNLWLSDANMDGYAGAIASWQHAFQSDADILLYGCDLASSESGQNLIHTMASLTTADVTASSDDTGHAAYGGDWILEYEVGVIDHTTIFSDGFQELWNNKLVAQTVDDFNDNLDPGQIPTTIREAIEIANIEGSGTLQLLAGNYNLSIMGTNEDSNLAGDFDITANIHIFGAGIDETIIDANNVDRIFDIFGDVTVTIEDLTLRNGDSGDGDGGAIRNSTGTLNLNNVRLVSNTSANGGALANSGTAVLKGVKFEENSADGVGGGIYQTGLGDLQLIESTLDQNNAGMTGGGIQNEGVNLAIDRSTLSNNKTIGGLGGASYNLATGQTTFTNTTLSGNVAAQGAAIYTESEVTVTNATIVKNNGAGSITVMNAGSVAIKNSILLNNNGTNTNQALNSLGFNIEDGANAFNLSTGDQTNANTFQTTLGDLSNNGGPTKTHALLVGSAAIDAGTSDAAPSVDQRNIARDSSIDIGAYEFVSSGPTATVDISANSLSKNNNSTSVTINFSETPVNFDPLDDLTVDGGTLGVATFDVDSLTWMAIYTANDGFSGVGSVTLIPDSYTNANLDLGSGDSDSVNIDTLNPTANVQIAAVALSDTVNTSTVTLTFTETPTGFNQADDLTVSGGTLSSGSFDAAGKIWTATFTANDDFDGTGSVTLANDSYTDSELNLGSGDSDSVNIDTLNPTANVQIAQASLSDTANSSTVTITFTEIPTNFDQGNDLTVSGGTLSSGSFDATGKIWTATFTANDDFDGTGSVTLTNNSYTDAELNLGSGDSDSVSIDTLNPTANVQIAQASLSDTANSSTVTITFTEIPTNFDQGNDLTVSGGTLSSGSFDATGKIWTATFTANDDFDGTGPVTLTNNSYTDAELNLGSGDSDSVNIDTLNPTANVQIAEASLSDTVNSSTVTITFTEIPTGFNQADDLTVSGGTLSSGSFDATGKIWTATFTANDDFDGTGSATLANDSYTDSDLNLGSGDSDSINIDTLNPTANVQIAEASLSDTVNSSTVTITFTEIPTGFNQADDLTVSGGTLSSGSFDATGKTWTATFTANDDFDGTGSVTLANDSYTNAELNLGSGDSDSVSIDTLNPTANVQIAQTSLSDTVNSSTVTITFTEIPTGFNQADDLTVSGGTLSSGSFDATGKTWTATFTANDDFDGTGSVTLANDSYTDAELNLGSGDSDSVSIDTLNPTANVQIAEVSLSDTVNSSTVTITFTEIPTNFDQGNDLTVSGGTLSSGSFDATGKTWTATFIANDNFDGTGSVTLANDSYTDSELNLGSGDSDSVNIDTLNPTANVQIAETSLSDTVNSSTVTITFTEIPTGFNQADDLTVSGGTLSSGSFDATGKIWTATFTANDDFDGTGSVTLANDSYTDAELNLGSGDSDSVSIDTLNPTANVQIAQTSLSDTVNSSTVTITFTEIPTGFNQADDLTVSGGTLSSGSFDATGKTWTATFTANDDFDGTGSVTLTNNSYTDAELNLGSGDSDSVSIDTLNPTANVQIAEVSLSDTVNSSTVTITFTESPTGFNQADDLTVSGGTLSSGSFDATGKTWTATFTANDDFDGTGSVTLANDSYTDSELNLGSGDSDSVNIDTLNPTANVQIAAVSLSDTVNSSTVTITFTEIPTGFNQTDDLTVSGGTLSSGSFDATGKIWTATFTANDDFDGTGSVTLANNSYTDAELNLGSGDSDSINIDTLNPTANVQIAEASLSDTVNSSTVTITFTEIPTGFNQTDDLTVSGGTLSSGSFDATGKIWTATFTANDDFDGTGSVTLANNSYTDAELNLGSGDSDSINIDTLNPIVTVDPLTTTDKSPALTGTINDPAATISLKVAGQIFVAVNQGDSTWLLPSGSLTPLSAGIYNVYVSASDPLGNTGVDLSTDELTIDLPAPVVTVDPLTTNDASPGLSGTINDPQTQIEVTVAGQTLVATNNGDGTWTVGDNNISSLPEGVYDIQVDAKNLSGVTAQDGTDNELVIDTTTPVVSVTAKKTNDPNPSLTGTTDDMSAVILVTVDGTTLSATNKGNGTWEIKDNQLPILAGGTYDVVVSATDNAGNIGNDITIDELVINGSSNSYLLNSLAATSTSGMTTAITTGTGKQTSDIGPSATETLNSASDSTSTPGETVSDGESVEDATESITTSPQTLLAAPQNGSNTSLQTSPIDQSIELLGLGETRVTKSIFTLSEAFENKDIYQTAERAESRIRSNVPKQFDGTTTTTLSRIQAIDSALIAQHGALWSQLDTQRDHMESQIHGDLIIVGAAGAAASGFTVGFIAWAFRAGFLASGLLAQLPAWKAMDPTLIMQGFEGFTGTGSDDQDTETLEQMMDRQGQAFKTN